jgi:ribose transport system substrate-binding protein
MSHWTTQTSGPQSRRGFLGLLAAAGGLTLTAPLLSACSSSGGSAAKSLPSAAAGVSDNGWKVIDQFYTLNNAYFQGWSQGAAQAAAQLALHRDQQVDNISNDKVISIYEQAKASGNQVISSMLADPGISPKLLQIAQGAGIKTVMGWNLAPWTTPFDYDDTFYQFITPDNITGAQTLAGLLFEKMGGSGELIHITGIPGNSVDITRTVGVDNALKDYPGIKLVARQPGQFDRGHTTSVIEALLTAHPDVKGIFCQNDDSAIAVINALNAQGKTVPVTGIDAIPDFLKAQQQNPDTAFATWAHHGAWLGGALMVRAYDVLSGVKLQPTERMMFSGGFVIDTAPAAEAYDKLMYSGAQFPYDFALMSRALHPDDWDPQNSMAPLEFESYFNLQQPKPASYIVSPKYSAAVAEGEADKLKDLYLERYKTDHFAEVRKLCDKGGKEFS